MTNRIPFNTFRKRTLYTTRGFDAWFNTLRDKKAARRIQARIDRLEDGNPGDYKAVGNGILELRIHHGPGFRVYFTIRGEDIIILLAGGDKSSQSADIDAAQRLAQQLTE